VYEFNLNLVMPFCRTMEKVRAVLLSEHLGIVSDVDVQAISKNKMDKEGPAYHILGACNPKLTDRFISSEPNAGTLQPCAFILLEDGAGNTVVSFMAPIPAPGLCETDEPKAVAAEAPEMLQRVATLGG